MRSEHALALGVIGILVILTGLIVLPYIQFVLTAILLAIVLYPLHERLAPRVGTSVSAILLVLLSVVAIIIPMIMTIFVIADDAIAWARRLQEIDPDFTRIEELIAEHTGQDIDVGDQVVSAVENTVQGAFGGVVAIFETITHVLIGLGLLLFLLFFLVRDGRRLERWLREVSPMANDVTEEFRERGYGIVKAVLAGHVLIAIFQGVIAGIGLVVVGIPNVIFWTFVMIILALVPLIGTFLVWGPAALYLVLSGDVVPGIALFVYGVLVVSISDEYLRPIVVDRFADISPSLIILGVLGGISAFGFIGLFVGPIIVGLLKEFIEVYDEYYVDS